jgi:anaerobic ribonucleoside-triphosphate reductase activating protein
MSSAIRVSRTRYPVTALGPGVRLGVWVQGCPLACRGCMSRDTWDPDGGHQTAVGELADMWRRAVAEGADGLTVSGGEPLTQPEALADLLAAAADIRGDREIDLLVYTGYTETELDDVRRAAVAKADALVVGRYDAAEPTTLIWRGSANQRILPRTELGRRRYGPYLDHTPVRTPLQVIRNEDRVEVIGVPRPGTLPTLERALRQTGVRIEDPTWRPSSTGE